VRLSELPKGTTAHVERVEDQHGSDAIARRLRHLGFVRGEAVRIVATGPFGGEPLLVQVGYTRFALRRNEAARVRVTTAVADVASPAAAEVAPAEVVA
jgi:ferrous iron transport protein A